MAVLHRHLQGLVLLARHRIARPVNFHMGTQSVVQSSNASKMIVLTYFLIVLNCLLDGKDEPHNFKLTLDTPLVLNYFVAFSFSIIHRTQQRETSFAMRVSFNNVYRPFEHN